MTTALTFHGHPVELIELAATLTKTGLGPNAYRMKRQASSNGYNGAPGYARIRSTCPKPCCAGRDHNAPRLVRYDALTVITEATP